MKVVETDPYNSSGLKVTQSHGAHSIRKIPFHWMFTPLLMWTKLRHQDYRNISQMHENTEDWASEDQPSGVLTYLNWSFCWMVPLRLLTQFPEPVSIFFPAPQSLYKHQTLCTPICILTAWDLLSETFVPTLSTFSPHVRLCIIANACILV